MPIFPLDARFAPLALWPVQLGAALTSPASRSPSGRGCGSPATGSSDVELERDHRADRRGPYAVGPAVRSTRVFWRWRSSRLRSGSGAACSPSRSRPALSAQARGRGGRHAPPVGETSRPIRARMPRSFRSSALKTFCSGLTAPASRRRRGDDRDDESVAQGRRTPALTPKVLSVVQQQHQDSAPPGRREVGPPAAPTCRRSRPRGRGRADTHCRCRRWRRGSSRRAAPPLRPPSASAGRTSRRRRLDLEARTRAARRFLTDRDHRSPQIVQMDRNAGANREANRPESPAEARPR